MLRERECHDGLGMDALVSVCSGNVNVMMVWAWMLWSAYALGTRTLLWFGHGCFGQSMLNTNDILDATRRVAAKTVSPKFYTVDPKGVTD